MLDPRRSYIQSVHRHVHQIMCCVTYLVQVYVNSDMSQSTKESFMDIWILTSTVIEKDDIKYVAQIEHIVKQ